MRTINFSIDTLGVTPNTVQNAGIKGENNATKIVISLAEELEDLTYALQLETANGDISVITDITETNGVIEYSLPYMLTSAGGTATVTLQVIDGEDVLYSYPMLLSFYPKSEDTLEAVNYLGEINDAVTSCQANRDVAELMKADCERIAQIVTTAGSVTENIISSCQTAKNSAISSSETALNAMQTAINSQNSAALSASSAETFAGNALTYKNAASNAAELAQNYAASAQSYKNQTATLKSDTLSAKEAAESAKFAAIVASNDASDFADTASSYKTAAHNSYLSAKSEADRAEAAADEINSAIDEALAEFTPEDNNKKADKEEIEISFTTGYCAPYEESGTYTVTYIDIGVPADGYCMINLNGISSMPILTVPQLNASGIVVGSTLKITLEEDENGDTVLTGIKLLKNLCDKQDKLPADKLAALNSLITFAECEKVDASESISTGQMVNVHPNTEGVFPIIAVEEGMPADGYFGAYIIDSNPSGLLYAYGAKPKEFYAGAKFYIKTVNGVLQSFKYLKPLSEKANKEDVDYATETKKGTARMWTETENGVTTLYIETED